MTTHDEYDQTRDAPAQVDRAPGAGLPDEAYYQQPQPQPQQNNLRRIGTALILIGLIWLAFELVLRGVSFPTGGSTTLVDRTLTGERVELSVDNGDVDIRAAERGDIQVRAVVRGGSGSDYRVEVRESGDAVLIDSTRQCFFCWGSGDLHVEVLMPVGTAIEADTINGDLTITNTESDVAARTTNGQIEIVDAQNITVRTTSGDIELHEIRGEANIVTVSGEVQLEGSEVSNARVETTSGNVELDGVAGTVDVRTISGDIEIASSTSAELHLRTTSGDIAYSGALGDGTHAINTISGDVTLELPRDGNFQLDVSTISGDIDNAFAVQENTDEGQSSATGTDGPILQVRTTSGDIVIEQE